MPINEGNKETIFWDTLINHAFEQPPEFYSAGDRPFTALVNTCYGVVNGGKVAQRRADELVMRENSFGITIPGNLGAFQHGDESPQMLFHDKLGEHKLKDGSMLVGVYDKDQSRSHELIHGRSYHLFLPKFYYQELARQTLEHLADPEIGGWFLGKGEKEPGKDKEEYQAELLKPDSKASKKIRDIVEYADLPQEVIQDIIVWAMEKREGREYYEFVAALKRAGNSRQENAMSHVTALAKRDEESKEFGRGV